MDRLCTVSLLLVLLPAFAAHAQPPESKAPTPVTARPDAEAKRCQAAQRRVDRQKQVVAELDARMARERKARETCQTPRQCTRLERALKASDARKSRQDRQLALFETDAQKACTRP